MRKKSNFSICAIMKNEGSYLIEWLEFHKLVGAERFYLYDNNSTDNTTKILQPYINKGEVVYHLWHPCPGQMQAYNNCLNKYKKESDWIAFIDLDEFLFPTEASDIRDILKQFDSYPSLAVNWLMFGTSNHIKRPVGLQIENFTLRATNESTNRLFKCIVRPSKTIKSFTPHHFSYVNDALAVTENYQPLDKSYQQTVFLSVDKIRINHYHTRSKQESFQKILRGRATTNKTRSWSYFVNKDQSYNAIPDLTIQRFLPELKVNVQGINQILLNLDPAIFILDQISISSQQAQCRELLNKYEIQYLESVQSFHKLL